MPIHEPSQANPPADASSLPASLNDLSIRLKLDVLSPEELRDIQHFRRAANYIAAAMIFLKDDVFVERKIKHDDIKHRLLGHWGTCPGLSLVYAHLNRLIVKHDANIIYVVGPGKTLTT